MRVLTAIIGPNGAGKSTLLRALFGEHPAKHGHLLLDGDVLQPRRRRAWQSRIGYMPQDNRARGRCHGKVDGQRRCPVRLRDAADFYARHQFPAEIIRQAIWLYLRFTLSYRDVEELLAERGIETSYESVRRWVLKFGPLFARNLRRLRPKATGTWHLDEMVIRIGGKQMYLWRAVDSEGEVLDLLVQPKRDTKAALRLMRKLLKTQGYAPDVLVTDKLGSMARLDASCV